MSPMKLLRRLPIRLRLTLAFALVMALVLAATGAFVYLRMQSELDNSLNQGLRSRTGDLIALVQQADQGLTEAGRSPLTERGETLAQILSAKGRVLDGTPRFRKQPLLRGAGLRRALGHPVLLPRTLVRGFEGPVRLLASPVTAQHQRLVVVVVGSSLDDRDE